MKVGYSEIDFNNIAIDKENSQAIDTETGEILDRNSIKEVTKLLAEKKDIDEVDRAKEKELKKMVGLDEKRRFNWKSNSIFIKIYRTEIQEYSKVKKPNSDEGLLLFYFMQRIEYETNRIAKPSKESFTNKELQELTGLGRDKLAKALNQLEEKLYIKRTGKGKAREIYFNPYLSCSGNEVLKTTVELFDSYDPITAY